MPRVALEGCVGVPRAEVRVAERGVVDAGAHGRRRGERQGGDDRNRDQRAGSGRGGFEHRDSFPSGWIAQCSNANSDGPVAGGVVCCCGGGPGAGGVAGGDGEGAGGGEA